MTSENS